MVKKHYITALQKMEKTRTRIIITDNFHWYGGNHIPFLLLEWISRALLSRDPLWQCAGCEDASKASSHMFLFLHQDILKRPVLHISDSPNLEGSKDPLKSFLPMMMILHISDSPNLEALMDPLKFFLLLWMTTTRTTMMIVATMYAVPSKDAISEDFGCETSSLSCCMENVENSGALIRSCAELSPRKSDKKKKIKNREWCRWCCAVEVNCVCT